MARETPSSAARHRVLVEPKQRTVSTAASMLIPATRPGLPARNTATRLLPLVTAARRLARAA